MVTLDMSPPLLPTGMEAAYIVIIDEILNGSDLDTVSTKRVRKGLQARVDDNIDLHKNAINDLIMARYDRAIAKRESALPNSVNPASPQQQPLALPITNGMGASKKRTSEFDTEDDGYGACSVQSSGAINGHSGGGGKIASTSTPPPMKRHKKSQSVEDRDAQMAARMQAEEYSRARNTRGGGAKRKTAPKKKTKKSKSKVTDDVDSDAEEGSGEKREVNRNSGFHKPMNLSEPLAALVKETQLSRPQTVKRIWEYIKSRELQDPSDKRMIICDDAMRVVFKTDKIHMFTMNKVLNQNLYAVDE